MPIVMQVSWKIGKVEKYETFVHHWKQEKVTIRWFRKIYWVIIVTHTAEALSEPSQTSKMELFAKYIKFSEKASCLTGF